jgi:hypothetical protein
MLARVGSVGGARAYPVEISIPDDYDRTERRLGMPGTATVFADNAGPIGFLSRSLYGSARTPAICNARRRHVVAVARAPAAIPPRRTERAKAGVRTPIGPMWVKGTKAGGSRS